MSNFIQLVPILKFLKSCENRKYKKYEKLSTRIILYCVCTSQLNGVNFLKINDRTESSHEMLHLWSECNDTEHPEEKRFESDRTVNRS